jgi:23S rRNA (pseudouridine1915-N3)-methyltransferase
VRLRVLLVGKGGNPWADAAVDDYARRVKRWGGVEEVAVKAEPFRGDVEGVRKVEGDRLLKAVGDRERLVVLDERGEDVDTRGFQALIEAARADGGRIAFAIGGAYGHSAEVRARATKVIRVSSLVLNHEIARVVLYEQIYRALAAIHGVPYAH